MSEVLFFIAGVGAIAGALGVVTVRNPFYAVLALVWHLLSLAALFLLLRAEFVAAAQVVVYAGAVMVLYVFVVAYVGGEAAAGIRPAGGPALRIGAIVFAGALAVELFIAILGSGLKAIDSDGAPYQAGFGTPGDIGELLLTRFLFPFEVASLLLLMSAVGAVVLARRRGGLVGGDEEDLTWALPRTRPAGSGTMREAVSGRLPAPEELPETEPVPAAAATEREERGGW